MPYVENPDDSSQNPTVPVQSSTYSLPNFDCVYNGGQCIHESDSERCTNGYLSFKNCPSGQCCKFGLNAKNYIHLK